MGLTGSGVYDRPHPGPGAYGGSSPCTQEQGVKRAYLKFTKVDTFLGSYVFHLKHFGDPTKHFLRNRHHEIEL